MDKKLARQQEVRVRKNAPLALGIICVLWLTLAGYVYFVDPTARLAVIGFVVIFYLAGSFTLAIITTNTKRGLRVGAGLTIFLLLRYFGVGNIVSFILLVGVIAAIEYYFSQKM